MSFWSNLSDFILKITWKKVMLFVFVIASWILGYVLIPTTLSEYLTSITPRFLPFGSTFVDVSIMLFAITIGVIVHLVFFRDSPDYYESRQHSPRRLRSLYYHQLTQDERNILVNLYFDIWVDHQDLKIKHLLNNLNRLKLILQTPTGHRYLPNSVTDFLAKEISDGHINVDSFILKKR